MKKIIDFVKKEKLSIIMILLLIAICFFFPYVHDDWAWGTSIGIERLTSLFKNYNGRWAGNILVIILTRSNLLKTIFMSLTFLLTIKFINANVDKNNKKIKYLIIFLLLLIPIPMFGQTISWVSGFTNYCVPVPIILYIIYINRNIFDFKKYELPSKLIVVNLLLGFVVSLFMEHVTIYNILLSILIVFFDKKINKKINKANIAYLIGSILGTFLMFSNGVYLSIFNAEDAYRTIEKSNIIITAIKTYFTKLSYYGVSINRIINIIMPLLLIVLNSKNKKTNLLVKIANIVIIIYLSYSAFTLIDGKFITSNLLKKVEGILIGIYCLSVIFSTFYSVESKIVRNKLLFYIGSIIILIAPLTIVTPLGPRCFYITYVFFILYVTELFNYLNIKNNSLFEYVKTINLIILILYFILFSQVFIKDIKRNKMIEEWRKTDKSSLVLPALPFEEYLWNPNPNNKTFMDRFKLFHKIDEDVTVIFTK